MVAEKQTLSVVATAAPTSNSNEAQERIASSDVWKMAQRTTTTACYVAAGSYIVEL